MVEFGDQKALGSQLLHHFESEEKPITFIVGSGLTCNTVPGVQWYVDRMRSRFTGDELDDFDGQVQGPTQAQKYQQAAKFAKTHRNQRWLNAIIGWGVLQAMPGGDGMSFEDAQEISRDERFLSDVEQDRSYWSLGEGVEAFGSLLAMTATRRWLVVTTNFDPLIEVSIQDSGEDPHTHALADDAKINRPLGRQKIEIAHVHGYYRSSTTLNAQSELDQSRPILTGSIKERLRGHYVVVCGYGDGETALRRYF